LEIGDGLEERARTRGFGNEIGDGGAGKDAFDFGHGFVKAGMHGAKHGSVTFQS
jgi:hypothetical protein